MKLLLGYASIEGHTAKIAKHIAAFVKDAGHDVQMIDLSDSLAAVHLEDFDRFILAGSVHERRHPKELEVFLTAEQRALNDLKTLFLSVSLSAAFDEGWEEANEYLVEMKMRTGFQPSDEMLVGGAVNVEKYDYFAQQVVKYVILRGRDFDRSANYHDFTDYSAVEFKVDEFLKA